MIRLASRWRRARRGEVPRNRLLTLQCGDVLVLEHHSSAIGLESNQRLVESMERMWPGHRCVVLANGLKLRVTRDAQ